MHIVTTLILLLYLLNVLLPHVISWIEGRVHAYSNYFSPVTIFTRSFLKHLRMPTKGPCASDILRLDVPSL